MNDAHFVDCVSTCLLPNHSSWIGLWWFYICIVHIYLFTVVKSCFIVWWQVSPVCLRLCSDSPWVKRTPCTDNFIKSSVSVVCIKYSCCKYFQIYFSNLVTSQHNVWSLEVYNQPWSDAHPCKLLMSSPLLQVNPHS